MVLMKTFFISMLWLCFICNKSNKKLNMQDNIKIIIKYSVHYSRHDA